MKVKKGAASFYIVAFSTLILVVIVASFTAIVLSGMARTENDDLSQSAYDAALAGVEDAKVAFYNYQKCVNGGSGGSVDCAEIKNLMTMKDKKCDMVATILGRAYGEDGVLIEETSSMQNGVTNNMEQAYTCVTVNTVLDDYRSTLTENDSTRVVGVKLDGVGARDIEMVKVSWYSSNDSDAKYNFANIKSDEEIKFIGLRGGKEETAVPPVLSVGLIQSGNNGVSLEQFEKIDTNLNQTNRGMVFLVPTNKNIGNDDDNRKYVEAGGLIAVNEIVKTNDRAVKNVPFAIQCSSSFNEGTEFACSSFIELPDAVGGGRRDDIFYFTVSMPYAKPNTTFALEFYCKNSSSACNSENKIDTPKGLRSRARLSGMQIEVDSTGRANNLYRRIIARLESDDTYYPFPFYALELLGNNNDGKGLLQKIDKVTCEWQRWTGFGVTGPNCDE